MSYIVPRQKPTACRNCHFMDRITYDCKLMRTEDYPDFETQYTNCPLIEIHTPHGRLIDADAIQDYNVETFGQRLLIIDTAPTVIEAED